MYILGVSSQTLSFTSTQFCMRDAVDFYFLVSFVFRFGAFLLQAAENPIICNNPITFPSHSAAQIQGWLCGLARFTDALKKEATMWNFLAARALRDLESEGEMITERWDNDKRKRGRSEGERQRWSALWTLHGGYVRSKVRVGPVDADRATKLYWLGRG